MPPTTFLKSGDGSRAWVGSRAPHPHSGVGRLGEARSEASLACLQVRSKGVSRDEWKDSETYSPNTAYGKTPELWSQPQVTPQIPATASWPDSLSTSKKGQSIVV